MKLIHYKLSFRGNAKQASGLIPLCPPLVLNRVGVELHENRLEIEVLTAVQISLLIIYDMCKAVDKKIVMTEVAVTEKGGNFIFIKGSI